MATLTGQTIAASYQDLVKRADTYSQTGTNVELMDDSAVVKPTGLYLESGATTDNVGIGVADPDELLELYKVGTQLKLSGGAADYATFAVAADGALTITTVDADAAEADIILAPDGNVGIGTLAPLELLDVSGSGETAAASPTIRITNTLEQTWDNGDVYGGLEFYSEDANGDYPGINAYIRATDLKSGTGHNQPGAGLAFGTGLDALASTKMVIDNTGNVGIGTASVDTLLHIEGSDPMLQIERTSPSVKWYFRVDSGGNFTLNDGTNSTEPIKIEDNTPSGTLYLDDTGNVGIGVTSPSKTLTVHTTSGTGPNGLYLRNDVAGANSKIYFYADNDAGSLKGASITLDPDTTNFIFEGVGGGNDLVIDSSGNVGINETSPSTKLHVHQATGNTKTAYFQNSHLSQPYGVHIDFSADAPDNKTYPFLWCEDSTADRIYLWSDGDIVTSDSGELSSDENLKTNIADATSKLEDVNKLRVRNFEWIPEYHPSKVGEKKIGFIAQEFEEVFPSLVNEQLSPLKSEKDAGIKRKVIKQALMPILVKAIQELSSENDELKSRIEALENA